MAPLRPLLPLDNPVRPYAWGSRTFLAALGGRATPSAEPEAELWMGAHPSAPSRVRNGGRDVALDALIAERPEEVLGAATLSRHGAALPFLLKLLAAAEPLSIQVHPTPEEARAGFGREEASGVPRGVPERSYPDPRAKPELLCALEPFVALHGFRRPEEIAAWIERLDAPELVPAIEPLRRSPSQAALCGLLEAILLAPRSRRAAMARAATTAAERQGPDAAPEVRWVARLGSRFPDDVTVLAPLFLNLVHLAPGEALFTEAGVIHTYLEGAAVELQASSDNVVRAGLTNKHVDVTELLRLVRFEPIVPRILEPRATAVPGVFSLEPPPPDLSLERMETGSSRPGTAPVVELDRSSVDRGPEVLLCTAGETVVEGWAGSGGEPQRERLRAGESLLLTAAASRCRLTGEATVFRARVATPDVAAPA
ncbi:MAG TPA: mannose-6-phosphate isomerase, class I [Thermoanaerobaculia bacterium]|nr:mannose-6-phosphate isomerase, class I [Thermoanaerobaculia bacterium]